VWEGPRDGDALRFSAAASMSTGMLLSFLVSKLSHKITVNQFTYRAAAGTECGRIDHIASRGSED
jgi:hypothetical protein